MDELKSKAKMKVLEELMALMDEKMLEPMKARSPKFAKVDIKSNDPEMAEELKDKLVSATPESESTVPAEDDEDIERLKEMYERMK